MMQAIVLALLNVVWLAGFQLVLRGALRIWPVGTAGAYSRVISLALLMAWVGMTGKGWRRLRPGKVWRWLLVMGAVAIVINISWFAGLKLTAATSATVLLRLDLLFVVLIGAALGLERISIRGLLTIPVMLVGLVLVMEAHQLSWTGHLLGDLMVVVAALGLASNAFVVRRILRHMDEPAAAFYNVLMSMAGFWALASYEGLAVPEAVTAYPAAWWWLVAVGIFAGVGAPLYYAALRRMMVWKLRAFLLLSPLIVALAEWAIWGVHLHRLQYLGAALLLGGVLALIWDEARSGSPNL